MLNLISRILIHIIFWIGVLVFYIYFFGVNAKDLNYVLSFSLFLMPITIVTTYVSIYKLIPDYLIKKRYFLFVLYSIYALIISSYLIVISIFYGLIYLSNFRYNQMAPISKSLIFVMVGVYLVVIIASAFKLLKLNFKTIETTHQLEHKILETQLKLKEQELNHLKMQIHPHFLFNTLNTMYGFALKKSDETPEMIIKLSNLLDYLLYQIDKPFVLLHDEINYIKDYIELEKMRFNDSLQVFLNTSENFENVKIPPLLLLPFVENSFKHGSLKKGVFRICMKLKYSEETLSFYIENDTMEDEKNNGGIGLINIKRRLDLLYKDNYSLQINNEHTLFKVLLTLNLETKK